METTRSILKNLFYEFFKSIGSYYYYRVYKNKNKPLVLTYHGVVPKIIQNRPDYEYRNFVTVSQFERQIQFLLKKYRPLKVTDFLNSSRLERGFLITFDDGFSNNYRYALPVLKKYNLQGCFFITTSLIGTKKFLWTDHVNRLIMNTNRKKIELELNKVEIFDLQTIRKKEFAAQKIRSYLKKLHPSKANNIIRNLNSEMSDVSANMKPEEEDRFLFMNWNEVREMIASDQIVGSHTHTHPILNPLSEEESYAEFKVSKEFIENNTGRPCEYIGYPNGEEDDYSETHKRQLQELGYRIAFTQINPFKNYKNDLYELNRINISLRKSMPVFEASLSGFI